MIFDSFPIVGGFRELEHGSPDGPSIWTAVRPAAPEHEGDLVRYLHAGSTLVATPSAVPDVLSESGAIIGGLHLLTDGHWLWYSDLAHYVGRYHVELDPAFIEHARGSNWSVPQISNDRLEAMVTLLIGDEKEPD
ncbi:hypothetical protein QC334_37190 [Streptomyces sp. DH18]|uniref:hypothetical protein n=1 Tax=Streptomyces sp. DH18 TaxID=3040126 RepID=UPI002442C2AA|nr:hypothetical protein [Streptomyces sp. DH18]MDG9688299.1 hypothetical protein [Streptomyces sp. DH18]